MMDFSDLVKRLASDAPAATTVRDSKPALLVSWWCTFYALTIIMIRLIGRWVRTEKVFVDDMFMIGAIVPLLLRMGFTHIVLKNGTNNAITDLLSADDILSRELGSKMVLLARLFYVT